jgi:hypothetical protein
MRQTTRNKVNGASSELAILSRILEPEEPTLSPDAARSLLSLDFRPQDRARMQELAAKARDGTLSPEEHLEIDNYEKVGHVLSLMKAKAKVSLKKND